MLPDGEIIWFRHFGGGDGADIWRVNTTKRSYNRFKLSGGFGAWYPQGEWIWCLTRTGLRRFGRFPPHVGEDEWFAPEKINSQEIHPFLNGDLIVLDSRIVMAGDTAVLVYDRQTGKLSRLAVPQFPPSRERSGPVAGALYRPIVKLRNTPFGVAVITQDAFCLLDLSGEPTLRELAPLQADDWRQAVLSAVSVAARPAHKFSKDQQEGRDVLALIDENTVLSFQITELPETPTPLGFVKEVFLYADVLWVVTERRLGIIDPEDGAIVTYFLGADSFEPRHFVRGNTMQCGPITVDREGDEFVLQRTEAIPKVRGKFQHIQVRTLRFELARAAAPAPVNDTGEQKE